MSIPNSDFNALFGSEKAPQRFWAKIVVAENGCWNWTGSKARGYATIKMSGKMKYAHRVSYEMLIGPVPDGMVMDHLCRNPPCVNPAHLEPVTFSENVLRGVAGERKKEIAARRTHCAHGHEWTPENTLWYGRGRRCKMCMKRIYRTWYERRGRDQRRAKLNQTPRAPKKLSDQR